MQNNKAFVHYMSHQRAMVKKYELIIIIRQNNSQTPAASSTGFSACNIEKWVWPGDEAKTPAHYMR